MSKEIIPGERIAQSIRCIRGLKVLLDSDLAALYGVATGNLNKAVKRNSDRFPSDFMFELKPEELTNLKFQFGTSRWAAGGGRVPMFSQSRVSPCSHVREKAPRYRARKRA